MEERLRKAFDQVQAEDGLKSRTKERAAQEIRKRQKRGFAFTAGKRWIAAAVSFVFLLVGFSGYVAYFTPVSAISIDIDPSFELELNRFDKVISVTGYNEAGEQLAEGLDLQFLDSQAAIEKILQNDSVAKYLDENEGMSITVIGEEEEFFQQVQTCIQGKENVYCYAGTPEQAEAARAAGSPAGNTKLFYSCRNRIRILLWKKSRGLPCGRSQDLMESMSLDGETPEQPEQSGHWGQGTGSGGGKGQNGGHQGGGGAGQNSSREKALQRVGKIIEC